MHLFINASGAVGCGRVFGTGWFQVRWPAWLIEAKPSIAVLELLPVLVACAVWGKNWHGRRLFFHSDNTTVVTVRSKMSSPNVIIMNIIRRVFFIAAQNNFTLRVVHISGIDNSLADALSRFDNERVFTQHAKADRLGVSADHTLEFLREAVLRPENCSNLKRDLETSLVNDWLRSLS